MHAITGPWMTHHGLKRLQHERADLKDWLGHIKFNIQRTMTDHRAKKEIDLILFENETVAEQLGHGDSVIQTSCVLPEVWCHEARLGYMPQLRIGGSVPGGRNTFKYGQRRT